MNLALRMGMEGEGTRTLKSVRANTLLVLMQLPEAALIRQEHIVRDMQLFSDVKLTRRGLIRYLALSLGLISPNESRTLILDILDALFQCHFAREEPDIHTLMDRINAIRPPEDPGQIKAVRYHLHGLKEKGLLERKSGHYKFALPPMAEKPDLGEAFEHLYLQNARNALEKSKKALAALEHMY